MSVCVYVFHLEWKLKDNQRNLGIYFLNFTSKSKKKFTEFYLTHKNEDTMNRKQTHFLCYFVQFPREKQHL